jgi:Tol biopolymer transport system component
MALTLTQLSFKWTVLRLAARAIWPLALLLIIAYGMGHGMPLGNVISYREDRTSRDNKMTRILDVYWLDVNRGLSLRYASVDSDACCPRMSRDGRRVALVLPNSGAYTDANIYVVDVADGNWRRLTGYNTAGRKPTHTGYEVLSSFSSWMVGETQGTVYIGDWDRGNPQLLRPPGIEGWDPAWSPDSRKIAFISARDGNNEIYTSDADGRNQRRLTFNDVRDENPVWSPDSQHIAFTSTDTTDPYIYIIDATGKNLRQLIDLPGMLPAWSPDGQTIAFTSWYGQNGMRLFLVNADGTNPRQLAAQSVTTISPPAWSPDGSQVVFVSAQNPSWEVYTIGADGQNLRRLTYNNQQDLSPSWVQ